VEPKPFDTYDHDPRQCPKIDTSCTDVGARASRAVKVEFDSRRAVARLTTVLCRNAERRRILAEPDPRGLWPGRHQRLRVRRGRGARDPSRQPRLI